MIRPEAGLSTLFSQRRSRLNHRDRRQGVNYLHDLVLSRRSPVRAAYHTNHHFDGSNQALAVLITASDSFPKSFRGATFTYRARLLLLFHIRPVERRRMQPPYCFRGATATCWLRSASLRLIPDTFWTEAQPITLMPAHPHSVSEPHTHALLLPLFPSLLATGSETLCFQLRLATTPVLSTPPSRSLKMFSRKGNTTTPSGFRNYHQTLFKGTDG